jgi:hypothetical protein
MPFYISYTLLSGSGSRFAETAADAVIAYNQLKEINAGGITIKDETGATYTIEQLLPATAPKTRRDRDPGPST